MQTFQVCCLLTTFVFFMITVGNSNGVVGMGFQFEVIPELCFITYILFLPLKFPWGMKQHSMYHSCLLLLPRYFICLLCCASSSPSVSFITFQGTRLSLQSSCLIPLTYYWVDLIRHGHESYYFQVEIAFQLQVFISPMFFSAYNEVSSTSMKGTAAKGVTSY